MKFEAPLRKSKLPQPGLRGVFRRAPETRYRRIGDEVIIVHQGKAKVIGLNEVGGEIFDLLDGQRSVEDILQLLTESFEVEAGRLREDVLVFLSKLLDMGLASPVSGSPE